MASHITERVGNAASTAADEVKNIAEDVERDVMRGAQSHPVASLLVIGVVVVGGGLLIAAMLKDHRPEGASGPSRGVVASAFDGVGPKGAATLSRIRDAAFSFVLDKAVDAVDEIFPGFREHYERG